jgi:hypothetical protein
MIIVMMKVRNKWKNALHALAHRYETGWSQRSRPNREMNVHVFKARACPQRIKLQ